MFREIFKKLITRYRAKKEHNKRISDYMYLLHFNDTLEQIKDLNRDTLINNLIEASGVDFNDVKSIRNIEKFIDNCKNDGMLTEFYTVPKED